MHALTILRDFAREFDAMMDHARTGKPSERLKRARTEPNKNSPAK